MLSIPMLQPSLQETTQGADPISAHIASHRSAMPLTSKRILSVPDAGSTLPL